MVERSTGRTLLDRRPPARAIFVGIIGEAIESGCGAGSSFPKLSSKKWRAAVSDGVKCRQIRIHRPNATRDA